MGSTLCGKQPFGVNRLLPSQELPTNCETRQRLEEETKSCALRVRSRVVCRNRPAGIIKEGYLATTFSTIRVLPQL